ncbi:MAG: hypothetical protein ACC661_02185 [Verrucomicrobiales bacterium]
MEPTEAADHFPTEYIVFWFGFGLVAALLAWRRGRGNSSWFWGSILLGPLGLLLIVILPRAQKQEEDQEDGSFGPKKKACPRCGNKLAPGVTCCEKCKHSFIRIECPFCQDDYPYDSSLEGEKVRCQKCGNRFMYTRPKMT